MKLFYSLALSLALLTAFGCDQSVDEPFGPNNLTMIVDFNDDVDYRTIESVEEQLLIDLEPSSELFSKTKMMVVKDLTYADIRFLQKAIGEDFGDSVEGTEIVQFYSVPEVDTAPFYPETLDNGDGSYPNDPLYKEGRQWNMTSIGVEKAWAKSKGKKVIVAVLDTGISNGNGKYKRVPDLGETCMVPGRNFTNDGAVDDPYDMHGHGTHVGGTIAQSTNNGIGVVGIAPEACLMPVKVLSDSGSGSTNGIAEAIIWATDNGARVINMSLGGGGHSAVMARAVKYAADKGVFLACAAGNGGRARIEYPAAHEGCHAISSVGKSGDLAFYSSYGTNGNGVFLAAPGGDQQADGKEGGIWQNTILTGKPNQHGYFPFQGTSMATPHVAGVAALVFGVNPKATLKQVEEAMVGSASPKDDASKYGHGILNAAGAVAKIGEGGDSDCESTGFGGILLTIAFGAFLGRITSRRVNRGVAL